MACRYTYQGKTYEAWEFEDVLKAMPPVDASKFISGVSPIPRLPFGDNTDKWLNLALKRIITMAVEGGYDKIAFVNGEQSADRYDLSKQVDSIRVNRNTEGNYAIRIKRPGNRTFESAASNATAPELVDLIGKELAETIVSDSGGNPDFDKEYSGLDLKVGGEGMKTFYDQIVPNAVKALAKKLGGGQMEAISLPSEKDVDLKKLGISEAEWRGMSANTRKLMLAETQTESSQPGFTITDTMREKAAGGLPLFAKNTQFSPAAQAQSVQAVESVANSIASAWQNAPRIVVAFDMQDPRIPERIRQEDLKQRSGGARGAPEGFFYNGTAYLMASQLKTPADTARVLFHEALGHFGLRSAFGDSLKPILQQIVTMRRAQVDAKIKEYGLRGVSNLDLLTAAEEVLAEMAQTTPEIGFVKRAIAAIRTWLRDHVPGFKNLALTDAEIIRSYILPARGFVERGQQANAQKAGLPVFNRTQDQTNTPAFKAWFGDSKVVDADGKPLLVYHGTKADFTVFDISKFGDTDAGWFGKGFYFADDKKVAKRYGKVMPGYLRIERPMSSNETAFDAETIRKIIARTKALDHGFSPEKWLAEDIASEKKALDQLDRLYRAGAAIDVVLRALTDVVGFDGVVSNGIYIAFRPEQIKSAIGNNGQFDPANPDIRFSRATNAIDNRLNTRRTVIAGDTGRSYTPDQLAALRNVGFQVETPSIKERAQSLWQDAGKKMAQGIVDQFAPVKEISTDAYRLLRLSKGASGAFEALLQGGKLKLTDGAYDFDETNRGGVVDKLLKPMGGEHHDFFRWVAANRAERLMGEGRERLFTTDDIAALKTLADGTLSFDYTIQNGVRKGQTTRSRADMYKDSLITFNGFNKNILDLAEQSGLIDPESRKLWEQEFYVPFYRVADEESGGVRGMNIKGSVVRQQAFKQLKGGKNALNIDLLENTLMNWAHLLDASAKNRAAKATLEAAERIGAAVSAPESTLRDMAGSIGKKNGVVWFMDGGQKRFYLVDDPYLLTAISSLEYAGMNSPVMKALGAFKHALTIGVTASPFFKVRNLIRDSIQVIGASDISVNPVKNIAEGWKKTDPRSDAYFRLMAGGGTIHFGTMYEGSEAKRVQALVESGVDESTILNSNHKVRQFYRRWVEPGITAYNELGNRGEAVNRAALYEQLVKQGVSHAEASLMARDLMDFSMQGSFTTIRFLSQVVPFFNARLQGLYKLGRSAHDNPKRLAYTVGAVALASLALLAAYSDDDDWKKRETWDRQNFWWFKFGGVAFRIPKPFELGAIGTLAEQSAQYLIDDEMTGKRFREELLKLLGDQLSMNPIPQMVKPILDVYANKDSFRGTPIESMGMERLKPQYRFNERTSMTARAISTAANAVTNTVGVDSPSPVQVDHLIRGYLGWLGMFATGAADIIARPATGQNERAAPDVWKMATGGMVSDLRDAPSRYVSSLYDQAKAIEQAFATWRDLQKAGKTDEAAAFFEDNKSDITRYRGIEAMKRAESKLNQQTRMIERNPSMTSDEKRDAMRLINQRKDQIARRAVELAQ